MYTNITAKQKSVSIKIAYIGGGSLGWAWGLMSNLVLHGQDLCGEVALYDIDMDAALKNEMIANEIPGNNFRYKAVKEISDAMTGADFVIISILPGTLNEMHSDVHTPERFGIYQPVGDTTGPGGLIRAVRTIPMFIEIGDAIKQYCPNAWVINYTNPMSICIDTLYQVFPKIKVFGCCHEVLGTKKLLAAAYQEIIGEEIEYKDIKVNVQGINHFTWLKKATYEKTDLFPIFEQFVEKYSENGYIDPTDTTHWMNGEFTKKEMVKMDLFKRYGLIAAAGDRHLSEFCPGYWYLGSPQNVSRWGFAITTVDSRRAGLAKRLARSKRLLSGEEIFEIKETGEEGVKQMKAILGMGDFITNVNLPNCGQAPDLPLGCIVETNAVFTSDTVIPVFTGKIKQQVVSLINRVAHNHVMTVQSCIHKDLAGVFKAFVNDPLVTIPLIQSEELFSIMLKNNSKYHGFYE